MTSYTLKKVATLSYIDGTFTHTQIFWDTCDFLWNAVNTLRQGQNGRHFADIQLTDAYMCHSASVS